MEWKTGWFWLKHLKSVMGYVHWWQEVSADIQWGKLWSVECWIRLKLVHPTRQGSTSLWSDHRLMSAEVGLWANLIMESALVITLSSRKKSLMKLLFWDFFVLFSKRSHCTYLLEIWSLHWNLWHVKDLLKPMLCYSTLLWSCTVSLTED